MACQRRAAQQPGRFSPLSHFLFLKQAQASPATGLGTQESTNELSQIHES